MVPTSSRNRIRVLKKKSMMHRFCQSCRPLISESFCRWKRPVRRYVAIGRRGYLDKRTFLDPQLPRKAGHSLCLHSTPLSLNARGAGLKYGAENEGRTVRITWDDGVTATFSAVWLRHNCQCPACITSSNQKAVDPVTLDPTMTVTTSHSSGKVIHFEPKHAKWQGLGAVHKLLC